MHAPGSNWLTMSLYSMHCSIEDPLSWRYGTHVRGIIDARDTLTRLDRDSATALACAMQSNIEAEIPSCSPA